MNYIKRLQDDNTVLRKSLDDIKREINDFRSHLLSAKFSGVDSDGSRKDWISTGDVLHRLNEIDSVLVDSLHVR